MLLAHKILQVGAFLRYPEFVVRKGVSVAPGEDAWKRFAVNGHIRDKLEFIEQAKNYREGGQMRDLLKELEEDQGGQDYPATWEPSEGDVLVGQLTDLRKVERTDGSDAQVISIKTDQGESYSVWLTTVLREKLAEEGAVIGCRVALKYMGTVSSKGGRRYHNWRVKVDNEGIEDTEAVPPPPPPPPPPPQQPTPKPQRATKKALFEEDPFAGE